MFTKKLSDIIKQDRYSAGGKGAFLGEMVLNGIPVPPGFVILAEAFDEFFEQSGLSHRCDQALQDAGELDTAAIDSVAKNLQELMISTAIPAPLAEEIELQFHKLNADFVAVRSSREMKKPCIIGTKNATEVFNNGDIVEVDAISGIVNIVSIEKIT